MEPRCDNSVNIFIIIQLSWIIHSKTSNWLICKRNPGSEELWFIDWCNMWCLLWPDWPAVSYTTHMLHQTAIPKFYYSAFMGFLISLQLLVLLNFCFLE